MRCLFVTKTAGWHFCHRMSACHFARFTAVGKSICLYFFKPSYFEIFLRNKPNSGSKHSSHVNRSRQVPAEMVRQMSTPSPLRLHLLNVTSLAYYFISFDLREK
jgi:hypothetical protein